MGGGSATEWWNRLKEWEEGAGVDVKLKAQLLTFIHKKKVDEAHLAALEMLTAAFNDPTVRITKLRGADGKALNWIKLFKELYPTEFKLLELQSTTSQGIKWLKTKLTNKKRQTIQKVPSLREPENPGASQEEEEKSGSQG